MAPSLFVREAYDTLSSSDDLSFGVLVSLAGSLAGKASQFESLSVQSQHAMVLEAVRKALTRLSSENSADSVRSSQLEEVKRYMQETFPTLLQGFEHAHREKKANTFWRRLGCELVEAWHTLTGGAFQSVVEPPKAEKTTPVMPEKTAEVVVDAAAAVVVAAQQPQQEEQTRPQEETLPQNSQTEQTTA